jgi:hypothetical protein
LISNPYAEKRRFFVTAEHLPGWLARFTGGSISHHRAHADGALVSHVANGAKHFRVDPKPNRVVKDTRAHSGAFQANASQSSAFDVSCLVIDFEDNTSTPVLEIAHRALDHWRKSIS